ncbi:hypothetical protein [Flectobacillus major]|uniref:hypothetical protein n=1 Tax=Flectobacillus major TaxID=103 RepID=UPI000403BE08|nr:hypothetical protein [Flectobacillus major]
MAKIEKALQGAILEMSQKEKDKLLLRLVAKDDILIQRLEFELLEAQSTTESRREEIRKNIDRLYSLSAYSSGYLMMDMREINAQITKHFKITKDKYGEVELPLKLLKECFEKQLKWIEKYTSKSDSLALYVAKRTEILLKKVVKLHPDIQFDFYEDLNTLLTYLHQYASAFYAKELKIPKQFEINES